MSYFLYKNGMLHADQVSLEKIAAEFGTPSYVYAANGFVENYNAFIRAFAKTSLADKLQICFAIKSNSNLAVLKLLAAHGAGADVVSGGELKRALAAGVTPSKIVFSGVGKTAEELKLALQSKIYQINVESLPELELLAQIAADMKVVAPIVLRINPHVDANTHAKITTGKEENKFGVNIDHADEICARAAQLPSVRLHGFAIHIGSQLTDLEPFRASFRKVADFVSAMRAQNHTIDRIDLGGGLGIVYNEEEPPDVSAYAQIVDEIFGKLGVSIILEPGRAISGNAGLLLTRVIYVKYGTSRRYLIVDAAMNDLARPTLYDAWHSIIPVRHPDNNAELVPYDIVGPVCESGDTFAADRHLPDGLKEGDLIAILAGGAYGATMSSTYNARTLVPEVLVKDDKAALVRKGWTVEDQMRLETLPDWV
jgi:diaminopimelate decarboxylase